MRVIPSLIILLAVMAGTGARASAAPVLQIGKPSGSGALPQASLTLAPEAKRMHAILTLTVATAQTVPTRISTRISVPRSARIVGMTAAIGDGPVVQAIPLSRQVARQHFDALTVGRLDPALLEIVGEHGHLTEYVVRVFPVTSAAPARVTIEIELAVSRTLEVRTAEKIPAFEVEAGGITTPILKTRTRIAIPAAQRSAVARIEDDETLAVDASTSLFADEPGSGLTTDSATMALQTGTDTDSAADREVRRVVRANASTLGNCFPIAAATTRVDLRFALGLRGEALAISVHGAQAANVQKCVAGEVGRWRFRVHGEMALTSFPVIVRPRGIID